MIGVGQRIQPGKRVRGADAGEKDTDNGEQLTRVGEGDSRDDGGKQEKKKIDDQEGLAFANGRDFGDHTPDIGKRIEETCG